MKRNKIHLNLKRTNSEIFILAGLALQHRERKMQKTIFCVLAETLHQAKWEMDTKSDTHGHFLLSLRCKTSQASINMAQLLQRCNVHRYQLRLQSFLEQPLFTRPIVTLERIVGKSLGQTHEIKILKNCFEFLAMKKLNHYL